MKIKNGFTLIELLSIIVILGLIALITIPIIDNSIKNSKEEAYKNQIDVIKKATNDYVLENIRSFSKEGIYTITLDSLKRYGYIDKDLKNPKTDLYFSDSSVIEINVSTNKYEYKFNLEDEENLSNDYSNKNSIVLNGSRNVYVELGTIYVDEGATLTSTGETIFCNTDNINTNLIGTYICKYVDLNDSSISASRNIIVRDTTPPEIYFTEATTTLNINEASTYDLCAGVTINDNSSNNLTCNMEVNSGRMVITGSLSNIAGKYDITYELTDPSGNKTRKVKKFIVTANSTN